MQADLGNIEANCARAERLAEEAFAAGAAWVILPEFFTSAMAFHPCMLDAVSAPDGAPRQLLQRLARRHSGVVGGSFINRRGADRYNTFVLAFPDGSTFCHDKDIPTMWENCYYVGGSDDGVFQTPSGRVGAAMCWELIRSQTARRLDGNVDVVVAGSCWWDFPSDATGPEMEALRARNADLLHATPATFASMLGVSVIHAAHAGDFEARTPDAEGVPYRSRWLGETQIVDGHGNILARRDYRDGEGFVVAEISLGVVSGPRTPIPETFWAHELPQAMLDAWHALNAHGQRYYAEVTAQHRTDRTSA
jgi:predicted amidohydrolase